jgi:hypothetical protein
MSKIIKHRDLSLKVTVHEDSDGIWSVNVVYDDLDERLNEDWFTGSIVECKAFIDLLTENLI